MKMTAARRDNRSLLLLIGITVIAALLRFIALDYAPSGGHGDVSWIGINALDWVDRGIVPFYVRELYSPEFLPILFTGGLLQIIGVSYLPQRIFTAAMGVLFVVLLYPMTYWLVGSDWDDSYRKRAGLLAAFAGAVSLHIVGMNRLGMESPPFLTTLTLFAWLTAWAYRRHGEPGTYFRWTLAGAALALNQYVYLPARLLPILLMLWMLHLLLAQRAQFVKSLRGWLTMAAVSFVLTLPAIALFLYASEAFSGRADSGSATTGGWIWLYDTSAYGGMVSLIAQKFWLSLQGIGIAWVGSYNLMNLPILSPVFFAGFLIAVALFIRRARQIAFTWSLLAILVLLITDVISGAVPEVHALHQMGTLPFVCVLSGLGLAWLWGVGGGRTMQTAVRALIVMGGITPTLLGMAYYLQTVVPAEYADPEWSWRKAQTDVDLGRYLVANADQSFLLPYSEYIRPDVAWQVAAGYRNRRSAIDADGILQIDNLPGVLTVVQTTDLERPRHDGYPAYADSHLWVLLHENTVYPLPPFSDAQVDSVMGEVGAADNRSVGEPLTDASGTVVAHFRALDTPEALFDPLPVIGTPLNVEFEGGARLLGYSAPSQDLQPGTMMTITLYWNAPAPLPVDYEVFAQLWDDDGQAIAAAHDYPFSGMYRSRIWRTDEVIATHHYLNIPPDTAEGRYRLVAGLFRYLLNEDVPVMSGGIDAPPFRVLRDLTLSESFAAPAQQLTFGDALEVVGVNFASDGNLLEGERVRVQPGDTLDVQLVWEALDTMPTDYSLFLHLTTNENAAPLAQADAIIGGNYPTEIWRVGEQLAQTVSLTIPETLPSGEYHLLLGLYDLPTGTRFAATDSDTPDATSYRLMDNLGVGE